MRIGIVAPSVYVLPHTVERMNAFAAKNFPEAELVWHPQVYARSPLDSAPNDFVVSNAREVPDAMMHGHFAGSDAQRTAAFVEYANRDDLDAIWFARGGYGAGRIAADILPQLGPSARRKTYMGYSDGSYLLALLYRAGFPNLCHGPMPIDIGREGGDTCIRRAMDWLVRRDATALEPGIRAGQSYAAFNLISLAMMVGTPFMPDISGHVLMLEEVGEYLYAVDRCFFAVTSAVWRHPPAEIRLGSVTDVKENDRPFGTDAEGIAKDWCKRANIRYGGRSLIGHDNSNHVVPFGRFGG